LPRRLLTFCLASLRESIEQWAPNRGLCGLFFSGIPGAQRRASLPAKLQMYQIQ
jgi:hypothetical protein